MEIRNQYKKDLIKAIPVVSGMNIDISKIEDLSIGLKAPLDTNINYEGTAFGGSLNTLCILSCYLLTHHILKTHKVSFSSLVIQNSDIKYLKPVDSDFVAISRVEEVAAQEFLSAIDKRGKGRITMTSEVFCQEGEAPRVVFQGRFVVF